MEKIVFKQTFRGFDTNQVLAYIDNMAKQLDEKEKEYQKNNEELTQELQDLSVSLSQNYERLVAEKRKVDDFSREIKYYRQENYKLKLKIEQLNKSLDDKD